jgi:KUP system potassium uptake protein
VLNKETADGHDLFNVRVQYGFMEDPDVKAALQQARGQGLMLDDDDLMYFLGRETIIVTRRKGIAIWREKFRADGPKRRPCDGIFPPAS